MAALNWPVEVPELTDGNVTLRGWTDEDAAAVFSACQDGEIQRFLDVPVPFTAGDATEFIAEQGRQWSSQQGASFAITGLADPEALGACSLGEVDAERLTAQVTCALDPRARGHHLAQRAVRLLCDWAFQEVGLRRLEFYIEPENRASAVVAERIGCRPETGSSHNRTTRDGPRDQLLYVLSAVDPAPTTPT
jgi:RimJ/RimL family protein N-acetyltransferase